jgi:hypothetical protein
VIDASASKAILTRLEQARVRGSGPRVPVVSMMIGPRAERGLVVTAGAEHSGGPADVLRRAKLAACGRDELRHFLDEFWSLGAEQPTFQPEPGCSAATFVGSWADVNTLASGMLNLAAKALAAAGPDTAHAHMLTQPHVQVSAPNQRQADFTWGPDAVYLDPHTGNEVRVARGACARSAAGSRRRADARAPSRRPAGCSSGSGTTRPECSG